MAAPTASSSAITFRRAVILASVFMNMYAMITLTGMVEKLEHHQLGTYGQSLVFSPWQFLQDRNEKDDNEPNVISPNPLVSDELSDFHIYNISKSPAANTTKTWPRPQMHVLIDARHHVEEPVNLCRTLLSVVIQGYPPPILVGYQPEIDTEKKYDDKRKGIASSTESFLVGALDAIQYTKFQPAEKRGGEEGETAMKNPDNIVMFLGRDQWVQMPAEVTVRRYLQHNEVFSRRLARSRLGGHEDGDPQSTDKNNKEYHLGVLFPASRRKTCFKWDMVCSGRYRSNSASKAGLAPDFEHRDNNLPQSSLPQDIHGTFSDQKHSTPARYQRPRYLGGASFIGSAKDVEILLKGALERIGCLTHDSGKGHDRQPEEGRGLPDTLPRDKKIDPLTYLFSEMFFEQEIERRLRRYQDEKALDSLATPGKKDTAKQERRWSWRPTKGGGKHAFLDWLKIFVGWKNGRPNPSNPPESVSREKQDPDDEGSSRNQNYEFSIALDYENRIFQDMADYTDEPTSSSPSLPINITNDIRFLSYSVPNLVRSPSRSSSHLFREPLMLPPELLHPLSPNGKSSPLGLNAIYNNLEKILEAAGKVKVVPTAEEKTQQQKLRQDNEKRIKMRDQEENADIMMANVREETKEEVEPRMQEIQTTVKIPWSSLDFSTNVLVPRGSIPSVLDMSLFAATASAAATEEQEEKDDDDDDDYNEGEEEPDAPPARKMLDSYWQKMWFNQKDQQRHQSEQSQKESDKDETKEEKALPAKYALLDEYRVPNPFIYALEAAAWGGEHNNWWNLRGGRGGFWTDQGAWIPWSGICYDLDV